MSAVVSAGRRLTASATTLRDSLRAALIECERAKEPSSSGGSGGDGVSKKKKRRVPTGEAGAALLGSILGGPYGQYGGAAGGNPGGRFGQ